ncbi:HEPN domain-containing protein [Aestuariispira insulae]|uniref:Uncharacterized protein n=1 Tax=Aestuariispira insulae TaxID=1461337 RepID=A0A3D9HFI0_9PROT|nr:HEPN domain-containing protein [Aestuariispira insulae]RED47726.1 hypothetical protein DFP90_10990 [Aestuariispira insulae]
MVSQTEQNLADMRALLPRLFDCAPERLEADNPHLKTLSDRVLGNARSLSGRAAPDHFRHTLLHTMRQRFVRESRDLDEKQLARMTSSAVRFHRSKLADRRHALPVHLECIRADSPVDLGPVRMTPITTYAASHENPDIRSWIGKADMVAEVTIPQCDIPMSEQRALHTVERARDILRLLAGEYHAVNKITSPRPVRWPEIVRDLPAAIPRGFALALTSISDPTRPWPLAARLLDGVSWYSIGSRENSVAAAITIWVNALERLTMTRDHMRITDCVAQRTALLTLLHHPEKGYAACRREADALYEIRCALVHGGASPFDPDMIAHADAAEAITRTACLGALSFFSQIGLETMPYTSKAMEKAYHMMEKQLQT